MKRIHTIKDYNQRLRGCNVESKMVDRIVLILDGPITSVFVVPCNCNGIPIASYFTGDVKLQNEEQGFDLSFVINKSGLLTPRNLILSGN